MASERITSYTEACQNLKSLMDSVIEDRGESEPMPTQCCEC